LLDTHSLEPIRAEQLYSYELGLRFTSSRFSSAFAAFDSEISDLIERRTLLLPAGAVGQTVGGQPIIRQESTGAVFTSLSNTAVFVRTNAAKVRMMGLEGSIAARLRRNLTVNANMFYIRGRDLRTGLPPSLENGIPPATGFVGVKWERSRGWIELYSNFAAPQRRFSDNDISQARRLPVSLTAARFLVVSCATEFCCPRAKPSHRFNSACLDQACNPTSSSRRIQGLHC
jgi:outer membrane receptor protein involved in Fe transport